MANLRRSLRPQQVVPSAPARRAFTRWPFVAGAAFMALLALAWIDGGEEPLRTMAQPVELPEQPR
jgi:hypothetical protein